MRGDICELSTSIGESGSAPLANRSSRGMITIHPMSTLEEAQNAINALNGASVKGRNMTVNLAKPREERAPGGAQRSFERNRY